MDRRDPRAVVHRGPPVDRHQWQPGGVAIRTRDSGRGEASEQAAGRVPRRAWDGSGAGLPFAAPLVCHAPDRGRLGPAVRAGTGRSRSRQHVLDLHLRVLRLPGPHAPSSPGRHLRHRTRHIRPGAGWGLAMKRQVDYTWQLRQVMAEHGMFQTTELVPLLRDRGIDLSVSQVHRLVTGKPERLSLAVLAALCDIFDPTPAQLITTTAANTGVRRTTVGDLPAPADLAQLRPKRARITPEP